MDSSMVHIASVTGPERLRQSGKETQCDMDRVLPMTECTWHVTWRSAVLTASVGGVSTVTQALLYSTVCGPIGALSVGLPVLARVVGIIVSYRTNPPAQLFLTAICAAQHSFR